MKAIRILIVCFMGMAISCGGASEEKKNPEVAETIELKDFLTSMYIDPMGRGSIKRRDLIGKRIETAASVAITNKIGSMSLLCGSGDEKSMYMVVVEFEGRENEVKSLRPHDTVLIEGVLIFKNGAPTIEKALLVKTITNKK